jgi:hypothetical protein
MELDDKVYSKDLIILDKGMIYPWWRQQGHLLQPQDLGEVIESHCQLLIVGTGAHGMMVVPLSTRKFLEARNIKFIIENTDKAVKIFNKRKQYQKVAAAFHLTC